MSQYLKKYLHVNKTGFTLVEVIVVIAILTILSTIAFISFNGYQGTARDSVRTSDIAMIKGSLNLFSIKS